MRSLYLLSLGLIALLASCPANEPVDDQPPISPADGTVEPAAASSTPGPAAAPGGSESIRWLGDATDFSFVTFEGETMRAGDFAGKPVVLNFWAAW